LPNWFKTNSKTFFEEKGKIPLNNTAKASKSNRFCFPGHSLSKKGIKSFIPEKSQDNFKSHSLLKFSFTCAQGTW
jgi:hypothetical protein